MLAMLLLLLLLLLALAVGASLASFSGRRLRFMLLTTELTRAENIH